MRHIARFVGAIVGPGFVLILAGSGCAQVVGIDDWSEAPSSGGAGGDSTSGAGQGGNGTGGSTSGVEVCDNSADDDGDSLTDCADSDCGSYSCVPPAPTGWEGPVEVVEGDPLPSCRAGWAASVKLGTGMFVAPAATCSPCACNSPSGGSCELVPGPIFNVYAMSCTNSTPIGYAVDKPDECYTLTAGTSINTWVKLHADLNLFKGGCQPAGGDATIPELFFEKNARACQPPALGAGCGTDGICMAKPMSDSSMSAVCIFSKDLAVGSCPPEYPNSRLLNAILSDSRGCSSCACSDPSGQLCSASAMVFADDVCGVPIKEVQNFMCDTVGYPKSFNVQLHGPNGGFCTASGGTPIGTVDLDTMIVCCR